MKILRFLMWLVMPAVLWSNTPARAQTTGLAGVWHGQAYGITFNILLKNDLHYSQQLVKGTLMTTQNGHYHLFKNRVIGFEVIDWEPKTQRIYHPTGTVGGYYTQEATGKPPGGLFSYQLRSVNNLTLRDVKTGGVLELVRVR